MRRLGKRRAQGIQELCFRAGSGQPGGADMEARRFEPHVEAIAEADERIARQPLAAFDALQQEARTERRQLQIGRNRCIQIRSNVEWWLHSRLKIMGNKKPTAVSFRRWVDG